jgi:hypothetical protein
VYLATTAEGEYAPPFESFLVRAIDPFIAAQQFWSRQPKAGGAESFRRLLLENRQTLATRPPGPNLNAILIAQAALAADHGLQLEDALGMLAKVLLSERMRPPVALGSIGASSTVLRAWLSVLRPILARALETADRAQRAQELVVSLEESIGALTAQVTRLESDLINKTHEADRLANDLHAMDLARHVERVQMRGAFAGFLSDRLGRQLASIREGLMLDPPRVPHSLERLDDADKAIDEQLKWLKSSD